MKMNLFDSSSQDYFHQIYAQNVKYVLHNTNAGVCNHHFIATYHVNII